MSATAQYGAFTIDAYRGLLAKAGWLHGEGIDGVDAVQQDIRDATGPLGILLRTNGIPSIFLRATEAAVTDPEQVYRALLIGWNLQAQLTAVPAPRDILAVYDTTRRPRKDALLRGDEHPVAELRLADVLDAGTAQRFSGQLLLLTRKYSVEYTAAQRPSACGRRVGGAHPTACSS